MYQSQEQSVKGFSLIELMVTVSIIIIVTGLALVRYSSFNNTVLLKSEALEIALIVREVQSLGMQADASTGGRAPYGLHIDTSSSQNQELVIFQDGDGDTVYDSVEELAPPASPVPIDARFAITAICVGSGACGSGSASVAFERPNFNAIINGGSATSLTIVLSDASGGGASRRIIINQNGYVAVD